jgi:hypothetical protein
MNVLVSNGAVRGSPIRTAASNLEAMARLAVGVDPGRRAAQVRAAPDRF